jgi:hypothetical protein
MANTTMTLPATMYRVVLHPPNGSPADLQFVSGLAALDDTTQEVYPSLDAMPLWVRERVSMLMMTEPLVPVDNVGMSLMGNTYWLYVEEV